MNFYWGIAEERCRSVENEARQRIPSGALETGLNQTRVEVSSNISSQIPGGQG